MIFFSSDQHFGHQNVIEYCERPFKNLEEMHTVLVNRWNERVKPHDTVYVGGDWSFMRFEEFRPFAMALNGTKILIRGNHDKYSVAQYYRLGVALVLEEAMLKIGQHRVRISHYPLRPSWFYRFFRAKYDLRYLERRPPNDGGFLIHGHTHDKRQVRGRQIHMGVDAWNFYPVPISTIESLMQRAIVSEKGHGL